MSDELELWIAQRYHACTTALLTSISPVELCKARPGFGRSVRAVRGTVVASPVMGNYDPQPDYFFHWFRDAALVIDALRVIYLNGDVDDRAVRDLADFVALTRGLLELDGRTLVRDAAWRQRVTPDFLRYLRPAAELAQAHGDAVLDEARVNADGTLDLSRWNRPQRDGAPLTVLALLRWLAIPGLPPALRDDAAALVDRLLDHVLARAGEPSHDIWEETLGEHYYNLRVSAAALVRGAAWHECNDAGARAARERDTAMTLLRRLDAFWSEKLRCYRARMPTDGQSDHPLDTSVILATIHSDKTSGNSVAGQPHSPSDPHVHATLTTLEAHFAQSLAINRQRAMGTGVALGRYPGDTYYGGGAWPICTLGAAQLCFVAARNATDASAWLARGDRFLRAVQAHVPSREPLYEQYTADTGMPTSARELAWANAACITCCAARRQALARL
ncbi:MAG TPA: glycoside hydrolase family 15 protein [Rhodanobacteraceae bacterium]|nr:glycoside hydrolase family 15 protein [Rhodanobacteraceae bacterium]